MKIIISPAKKMNVPDSLPWKDMPVFLKQAEELKEYIRSLSYGEAKALWKCSDKLAEWNMERFAAMDIRRNPAPAVLSYEGLQYQYMAPEVMEEDALAYLQGHLRILSGFYGILKPFDGVVPYRLEMQAKAKAAGKKDLYEYWGDSLYRELTAEGDHTILNLASKEYAKCIEAYLASGDRYLTCVFGELCGGRVIQKGTMAKMARGEMVRFLAEKKIERPEEARQFDRLGYGFCRERSSETEYIFLKQEV